MSQSLKTFKPLFAISGKRGALTEGNFDKSLKWDYLILAAMQDDVITVTISINNANNLIKTDPIVELASFRGDNKDSILSFIRKPQDLIRCGARSILIFDGNPTTSQQYDNILTGWEKDNGKHA